MLVLCHSQVGGQVLTNAMPPAEKQAIGAQGSAAQSAAAADSASDLPDDPEGEALPMAVMEPVSESGVPVTWEAEEQKREGELWTLSGEVVVHYRGYTLRADRVVYHHDSDRIEAEGHLQATGGPGDILLEAERGEIEVKQHRAKFFNVKGTMGVRQGLRSEVYTTTNPLRFRARVLLELGDQNYRIVGGAVTNCRMERPDWELVSGEIAVKDGLASAKNVRFSLLGLPIFDLPYLQHPVEMEGRQSGLLLPVFSNSSVRGYTFGESVYLVLGRSMDMVVGAEYYSKRGYAPSGDFRYKGPGLDHLLARWNALLDRGVNQTNESTGVVTRVNQGGVDVKVEGRKDFTPNLKLVGNVEYLSNFAYRLTFNDDFWQAVSSQVQSHVSLTAHHGPLVPSFSNSRFQNFASAAKGDEVRIIHLPSLRYDVLDLPIAHTGLLFGLSSSLDYLNRSEYDFHARNMGRLDLYPRLSLPFSGGGWQGMAQFSAHNTFYPVSQNPDLSNEHGGIPVIRHELVERRDAEFKLDLRAPALERDFVLSNGRVLRHVIEPELGYRVVNGIGDRARNVVLVDTQDIAVDTNEVGYSLTQHFYVKPAAGAACKPETKDQPANCKPQGREWATWQIAQKYFFEPDFHHALVNNRRNVFDTTLDLSGVAFLAHARNLSPIISRMRMEAIPNLRMEWDMDYDPRAGRLSSSNLYAGYGFGKTTVGVGHNLLRSIGSSNGKATVTHNQQVLPFVEYGKQSGAGLSFAAHGSYDLVQGSIQYAGVQTDYNWDCCGLTMGYRRFTLGTSGSTMPRDETQYLYGFTISNFGAITDIRRANRVFRDPNAVPVY